MKQTHQDIRILSLYKQHYFDHYIDPDMDSQYSCLGYYDGIGISRIPESDMCSNTDRTDVHYSSQLFKKKSQACLSRVWSGAAQEMLKVNGKYSKQIIGLFRCISPDSPFSQTEYYDAEKYSPYLLLLFLQAKNHADYARLEQSIYELCEYPQDLQNPYISFSVYHTYDNADLVVLAYSNSMQKLGSALSDIRALPDVCYLHPMIGISEAYLNDCQCDNSLRILPEWHDRNCFIEDPLAHLTMKIAASGFSDIPGIILNKLNRLTKEHGIKLTGYENIVFSAGTGHGNLRMDITNTDVKSLIALLSKYGMLIHNSGNFGTYIYNIETSLYWKSQKISETKCICTDNPDKDSTIEEPAPFFSDLATQYRKKAVSEWEKTTQHDEGLFGYYIALSQVYNTLAQYEGFSLARDIFSLLFPAVKMFEHLLELADQELEKTSSADVKERRNDSICEFVNAVNSVVYHTIHTDQIFLMIPGYSGSTYSIPVKLCLMYSWIIQKVITILNDTDYRYACMLTPELETRPVTTLINMGMFENDRLIRFSSSQRSLYMPRHFIILITHELAHYVGRSIRNRHLRLNCISRALAFILAEGIFPSYLCPPEDQLPVTDKEKLYILMRKTIHKTIEAKCLLPIHEKILSNENSRKEHATEIIPKFKEICYELLEEKGIIHNCIFTFPDELDLEFSNENKAEILNMAIQLQIRLDRNRRILISSHKILDTCISELVQLFREVFSDLAALAILEYDEETFSEVFNVSEGSVSHSNGDVQRSAREWIIRNILYPHIHPDAAETASPAETVIRVSKEWPYSLVKNLFTYAKVGECLTDYAHICYKAIKKQVNTHRKEQEEVKAIYKMFSSNIESCSEIYRRIVNIIEDYNRNSRL